VRVVIRDYSQSRLERERKENVEQRATLHQLKHVKHIAYIPNSLRNISIALDNTHADGDDEEIAKKCSTLKTHTIFDFSLSLSFSRTALYKQPNKIVVLTGGNKGIGLGILRKLLECEMTVVLGNVEHSIF
jgi:hypothetical protein